MPGIYHTCVLLCTPCNDNPSGKPTTHTHWWSPDDGVVWCSWYLACYLLLYMSCTPLSKKSRLFDTHILPCYIMECLAGPYNCRTTRNCKYISCTYCMPVNHTTMQRTTKQQSRTISGIICRIYTRHVLWCYVIWLDLKGIQVCISGTVTQITRTTPTTDTNTTLPAGGRGVVRCMTSRSPTTLEWDAKKKKWPPWPVEEGDMASFFVQDLGLALVAKTCPHRPQAFETVHNGQAFLQRNSCFFSLFLMNEPIADTLRHAYKRLRAVIRRSDRIGPTLSHTIAQSWSHAETWYQVHSN